jgi:hypothetical protein
MPKFLWGGKIRIPHPDPHPPPAELFRVRRAIPVFSDTARTQAVSSPNQLDESLIWNGRRGTRTHDPLIKSQLLYQLSYAPIAAEFYQSGSHLSIRGRVSAGRDRPIFPSKLWRAAAAIAGQSKAAAPSASAQREAMRLAPGGLVRRPREGRRQCLVICGGSGLRRTFDCAVMLHHSMAEFGQGGIAAVLPGGLRGDERGAETMAKIVDKQPGPPVGHAHSGGRPRKSNHAGRSAPTA